MEEGSEYYVLRKGNTVAVYKSLSECQAQSGLSDGVGSSSDPHTDLKRKGPVPDSQSPSSNMALCILHFDGASKGNPGKAGAGALLKTEDGRLICRLSEGLGVVTNNVAEYKALLLGLRHALMKGFKRVDVQGDSMLVVMQVQGKWKVKHQDMIKLCKEVNEVKKRFNYFNIQHVRREFNSDADHQANLAIELRDGQVTEVCGDGF
ncbi:RNase H family protein [Rhynchospora pubera]|uniref:RNase H family protein n=1 Tax=Rhynchospora pubera TaxID=906938 RepID=A0AAV8F010_9POAL|nr:RNase H family protein [Rhynchospora pubera]